MMYVDVCGGGPMAMSPLPWDTMGRFLYRWSVWLVPLYWFVRCYV